jgi:membrane fusion protein, heavy metal efflux system
VKKKIITVAVVLAIASAGAFYYRSSSATNVGVDQHEPAHDKKGSGHEEHSDGHEAHVQPGVVRMSPDVQKQNGVVVAAAGRERLAGVIGATGKVEANADRIAHVSPRIPGKIVSVGASLGDSVSAGQPLATIDSVELGEAISRYRQSGTKLALARSNMERVKILVDKKIAARKEILQAETEYRLAQTELQTDRERLSLYGAKTDYTTAVKPLLPVRSPIGGIITEKHAIVGELADPSKNLYTVADLSSVWIMVDINEKDLPRVHKGQRAVVTVNAFPDFKLKGRITYIADAVDQSTRTVKSRIEVTNRGHRLKPEMFATVELALPADAPPVVAVPEDAVQDLDGRKVVFAAGNEGEFIARQVDTGRVAGGLVEIVVGLKEGERYAVKGAFVLKSEMKKGELVDEHDH